MTKIYDAVIIGGGPSGLSIGSELAKKGHDVLVVEKGKVGETARSWIVPGSIIEKLDEETQKFAYNGVTRFLEHTPHLEIKWDAVAPWKGSDKWKRYPYIDQEGILKYWAEIIKEKGSEIKEQCSYIDYTKAEDGTVEIRTVATDGDFKSEVFKAKLVIDASGYSSQLAKKEKVKRDDYFWWSVYGFDIEFEDISKLKHPGNLGNMQIGDYMLWQSFKDMPMDPKSTLSELRPIMEYEVLDEKRVFVFILYFAQSLVEKDFMENQFSYILQNEESIKSFREGTKIKERFGWYPSNGLSQEIAEDNIAFVGDSGCWTIPAGWGMSFILNNYKVYAESLSKLIKNDKLAKEDLEKIVRFNERQEYEILMDKLVLHFMAYADPDMIDKFTKTVMDAFGGERLEIMFCLQMTEKEAIETLKVVFSKFELKELASIFKENKDYKLLLSVAKEFVESSVVDGFRSLFGFKKEEMGFEFKK